MDKDIKNIIKSKFAVDSFFNLMSVILLGICGLLLNFTIARKYGAQTLGVFNEVYAFYIIFSQFAALGVQVSSLKHIAQFSESSEQCKNIFSGAFIIVVVSSSLVSAVLYYSRFLIAGVFGSPEIATGILWVIPGLWCFSINKLFMNVLNGLRRMKEYAVFSSIRYLSMLLVLFVSVEVALEGEKLSVIFTVSECFLFILLVLYCRKLFFFASFSQIQDWIKRHLSFGSRSMIGGITADMNTRIDVIILGYFTSERIVGIYSFAATIIEGLGQIPYIFKQNIDPIIAKLAYEKRFQEIKRIVKKGSVWAFYGMLMLGIVLVSGYQYAIGFITDNPDFRQSWPVFCILMAGVIVQSSYMPFSGILVQSGFPFLQTIHLVSFTLTNITLNMLFVPLWGMVGSAIALSLSLALFVVYLKVLTFRALKIAI
jgi:O-antigen/teichoic acid export membrane protein